MAELEEKLTKPKFSGICWKLELRDAWRNEREAPGFGRSDSIPSQRYVFECMRYEATLINKYMDENRVDHETATQALIEERKIFGREQAAMLPPTGTLHSNNHPNTYGHEHTGEDLDGIYQSLASRIVAKFSSTQLEGAPFAAREVICSMSDEDQRHIKYGEHSGIFSYETGAHLTRAKVEVIMEEKGIPFRIKTLETFDSKTGVVYKRYDGGLDTWVPMAGWKATFEYSGANDFGSRPVHITRLMPGQMLGIRCQQESNI